MIGNLSTLGQEARRFWSHFSNPIEHERREANQRVWSSLPENLKVPGQAYGTQQSGCAATYNIMEKCNFSCTACYLSKEANHTPPLPFEEVCQQIDEIRRYLGPGGNIQITAGEVTLLPVEELTRIVKYAIDQDLSPMVMTHGDTFRDDPGYLDRLIQEGGLEKVSIHIDTTQRGRRGQKKGVNELDLMPLRDEFADLVRQTRLRTGKHFHAAHTYTIDPQNFAYVGDVVRWSLENADAFRLVSFQPTADVGRTRTGSVTGRRDRVWEAICSGAGTELNRHNYLFGHPDCNFIAMMFVVKFDGELHVVEVNRDGKALDQLFSQRIIHGAISGFNTDNKDPLEQMARLAGRIRRQPSMLLDALGFCGYRAWTEREWIPRLLKAMATGRPWSIHPFAIVVHNFMSRDELDTPVGRARLQSCTFRLPVEGQMVPMCQMNGTGLRTELNLKARTRLSPSREKAA